MRQLLQGFLLGTVALAGAAANAFLEVDYFKSLRNDLTIPQHCREVQLSHFNPSSIQYFTLGSEGAVRRGFDYEYPLHREHARRLWSVMKDIVDRGAGSQPPKDIRTQPALQRDFTILESHYAEMGFDFGSEGEILELLAIVDTYARVSDNYYVYGSVFYVDQQAGELDLIIARKTDCQVQAVGEAKLGLNGLGKAHRQLQRFKRFIEVHSRNFFESLDLIRQL